MARTFQEIQDFVRSNAEVRNYHEADAFRWSVMHLEPGTKEWRRYRMLTHDMHIKGVKHDYEASRVGTFYFGAMQSALHEFLGVGRHPRYEDADHAECVRTHMEYRTLQHSSMRPDSGAWIYVTTRINSTGVEIRVDNFPLATDGYSFHFTARSHREYTVDGVIAEVKAYIEKHYYLPEGRYREIQLDNLWTKEEFFSYGYRAYKKAMHEMAEAEHWEMLEKYEEKYDDSYLDDFVEPMLRNDLGIEDAWEIDDACDLMRRMDMAALEKKNYKKVYSRQAVLR